MTTNILKGDYLQDGFICQIDSKRLTVVVEGGVHYAATADGLVDWDFPTVITANADGRVDLGGGREFLANAGEFERIGLR